MTLFRISPLIRFVAFFVGLSGLASETQIERPTNLTLNDGTVLAGRIVKIEGLMVHLSDGETKQVVDFNDLSLQSRKETLQWSLPLLFKEGGPCRFKAVEKQLISRGGFHQSNNPSPYGENDHRGMSRVSLINESPMQLPEGLRLDLNIHAFQFHCRMSQTDDPEDPIRTVSYEKVNVINFPCQLKLKSQLKGVSPPHTVFMDAIFSDLSFTELMSDDRHSINVFKYGGKVPQIVQKNIYEYRFSYGGDLVFRHLSDSAAEEKIRDLWMNPEEANKGDTVPSSETRGFPPPRVFPDTPLPQQEQKETLPDAPPIPYGSIAILSVGTGTGTGFLVEMQGKPFLMTNVHVVAGAKSVSAKTLNGADVAMAQTFFIAKDRDVALIPIRESSALLNIADTFEGVVKMNDYVTVYGNEAGASVATSLTGKIQGIGPARIEVDAKFVEGNSGSPVVHHDTGKVVGIATYYIEYEIPGADLEQSSNPQWSLNPGGRTGRQAEPATRRRRFAERVDNITEWESVTLTSLRAETLAVEEYKGYLQGLLDLAVGIIQKNRMLTSNEVHPQLKPIIEDFHHAYDGRRRDGSGNRRAIEELTRRLSGQVPSIRNLAAGNARTQYFKKEMRDLEAFEKKLMEFFNSL